MMLLPVSSRHPLVPWFQGLCRAIMTALIPSAVQSAAPCHICLTASCSLQALQLSACHGTSSHLKPANNVQQRLHTIYKHNSHTNSIDTSHMSSTHIHNTHDQEPPPGPYATLSVGTPEKGASLPREAFSDSMCEGAGPATSCNPFTEAIRASTHRSPPAIILLLHETYLVPTRGPLLCI